MSSRMNVETFLASPSQANSDTLQRKEETDAVVGTPLTPNGLLIKQTTPVNAHILQAAAVCI